MTIERLPDVSPAAEAFFEACQERGYPVSADLNGAQSEGVSWYDRNIVGGAVSRRPTPISGRSCRGPISPCTPACW